MILRLTLYFVSTGKKATRRSDQIIHGGSQKCHVNHWLYNDVFEFWLSILCRAESCLQIQLIRLPYIYRTDTFPSF